MNLFEGNSMKNLLVQKRFTYKRKKVTRKLSKIKSLKLVKKNKLN